MSKRVRVRFAPSPTGGLHLGGVRTVLFNYLFAKKHQGDFIVRIEDTDQSRYVPGAEEYIFDTLRWCGLEPDESVQHGGNYGPYRQSERKAGYRQYAEQLVKQGHAYYAFDTPEELDQVRKATDKNGEGHSFQYDHTVRMKMRNSLNLLESEVQQLLNAQTPHVIRIKMPENETVSFTDMIRGEVSFETALSDDKVLLKADGMPTYHLAVVVDDHLMEISHAFRGEEWLPSAPVHILLWKYLFGLNSMPQWAHFPLILGPQGKLSKRDGAKYGFPVFAMNWKDPKTGEFTEGFKEKGFIPEAFINLLALLGWNDGTEKELYSLDELAEEFTMERVHSSGAKFDFEKAKWFNHEWIKMASPDRLQEDVKRFLGEGGISVTDDSYLAKVIGLVKERCTLLSDFVQQTDFFFRAPAVIDQEAVKPKWSEAKKEFFQTYAAQLQTTGEWNAEHLEQLFKETAAEKAIKPGELQLPFRIMLVGGKFGPQVFQIAELLGKDETLARIQHALPLFE
ncbi:MAG: glutamate--tRNA ligase [Bacteroidetes bacterium]|nr:glutamate--tRNA ligase [Bacteroidota bacterium]